MTTESTLACKGCGIEKPRTAEFWHRDKNVPDGFCRKCKDCRNSYRAWWYIENWDHCQETSKKWRVANPEKVRENQLRYANDNAERLSEYKKQWRLDNIDRVRVQHSEYYQANKEAYRISVNRRRQQNPGARRAEGARYRRNNLDKYRIWAMHRRARVANAAGEFTADDVEAQLSEQSGLCFWCYEIMPLGKHTIDHLIPLSRGGSNWPSNLVCACHSCNSQKGAKTPDEYRKYLEELGAAA